MLLLRSLVCDPVKFVSFFSNKSFFFSNNLKNNQHSTFASSKIIDDSIVQCMKNVGLLFILFLLFQWVYPQKKEINYDALELKDKAFEILETSCNYCHDKRNPSKVFSAENMSTYSNDIYVQVFVKKRMPKGRNNSLSPDDQKVLLRWISSLNN